MPKAVIVNTGIVTSIGNTSAENHQSLVAGTSGIAHMKQLHSHWAQTFPVGEVKYSNEELAALLAINAPWPRTALLSALAAREARGEAADFMNGKRCGFFSANTIGGMDFTEHYYPALMRKEGAPEFAKFRHHEGGEITNLAARYLGLEHGFVTTLSTACSSSANSIMMAAQMIEAGLLDVAIAGGADALCRFTLNGFHTLMILDREPCQPFDANRRGLNLGEGAGYLLLMSEEAAAEFGKPALASLSGYANANDAWHQTASSPEGIGNTLAMKGALRTAQLEPAHISYINLHGTGTANNDLSEGIAIENVFGSQVPHCSSTKAYTGHTLGAAGGVEAAISVLALQHQCVYPTLRWQSQMPELSFAPRDSFVPQAPLRHVLSNSFGFGGNCSTLIFSQP